MNYPGVGIGIILFNKKGEILIGKRKGSHAPYYSIPGGHLEPGESFESAAIREMKEETSVTIIAPKVMSISNNIQTYLQEGLHYISIGVVANEYTGEVKLMEPDKCEGWQWCEPNKLPQPHFEASQQLIQCYLDGHFYQPAI